MKIKSISTITIACFLLCSCGSKTAINYNNMIVEKQKTLGQGMDETEPDLKNYFANFQYDSIATLSNRMEIKIDSIIREIEKRPSPTAKQGDNFKKAALVYFNFMKGIYTSYKNYGLQTTPQGRQFQLQVMSTLTAGEDKAIADMQRAQKIFAKDNGFKLRSEKKTQSSSLTASAPE